MPPRLDFSSWWVKDTQKGTPVVVKMENPSFSVVEINGADAAFRPVEKNRGKNAKQVTWVLLLKAHRAVGCVAWLATVLWDLLGAIKKRLFHMAYVAWLTFRAEYIAPPIKALSKFCIDNPELGLVQARWSYVNKDENLLTRLQNINLCFHFEVEQQVNGVFLNFFGFNGTAGVWRIKALEESGGWLERTTVEDMDIAVRAHLNGWKFIFLNDVKVLCEVPESYEAYRKQQHRWHSGPMQLFRLCLPAILKSKVSPWKKANLILLFFLLRKLILPFYSFTLFCIILPLTMFVPEAELPLWLICYVPVFMSILNILPAPKSFPFIVPYLLFENTMSVTKFNAMVSGLFQLGSSYEWIVTKKAGRSSESDLLAAAERETKSIEQQKIHRGASESELVELQQLKEHKAEATTPVKKANKIYKKELTLAFLLLTASGVTFLLVGLDLIGEQMS
ncbi:hypothetical protein TSUD_313130 [Trifolium subterraneum]|uniref:Glycosyltransferase 2-like domain-containing protein n=1 Tax=Trifolium subterraneum TaxID=3900 RepID=A0A2Z6M6Y7_TRISU|nr:hypothetical protein TSUD_313130 [Trifolium subterraneum]